MTSYYESKKKKILKRNKRHLLIYQLANIAQEEDKKRDDDAKSRKRGDRNLQAGKSGSNKEVWSAKLQKIRNRNDGHKRDAQDRWNRFAGTSDGGGKGL